MNKTRFWMVLGSAVIHDVIHSRHGSEASARSEAERLAKANPEYDFTVLTSVCTIRAVSVETIEHTDAEIPF